MGSTIQQYASKRHRQEKKLPIIKPDKKIAAEARYRINVGGSTWNNSVINTEFATNVDVFKGTFFSSGSANFFHQHFITTPIYWNYTLQEKDKFHLLQLGSTFYRGSLLVPLFNLKYAINFQRLKQVNLSRGFIYQGHTMPNAEVDVWHNGILVKVLQSSENGGFTINLPNAKTGDTVKLVFFYRDGTHTSQKIRIAPDNSSLLKAHQWDTDVQAGEFDEPGQLGDNKLLGHVGFRYGLTDRMTVGIQALRFPSGSNQNSGGVTVDWEPWDILNILAESLSYSVGTDYGIQANFTGLANHLIQLQTQQIQDQSPLRSMAMSIIYSTLPFNDLLPNTLRFWAVKDTVNFTGWQLTSEYRSTNSGDMGGLTAIGSVNHILSVSLQGGVARPHDADLTFFAQTNAYFYINAKNLLELRRSWIKYNSSTILYYRYQSLHALGWNVNLGFEQKDDGDFSYNVELQWKITRNLSTTLTMDHTSVYFQLSWLDILSTQPGPQYYEDFATGTVEGKVLAPPQGAGDQPLPVKGAIIQVGALTTQTDENGDYFITGIPTNAPIRLMVEADSLDASLIPDKPLVMMQFRPGTSIHYSPKLDWTSGLDGQVDHATDIPPSTKVDVVSAETGKVVSSSLVEKNGFFTVQNIRPGKYYVLLEHIKQITPVLISVKNNTNWLANIHIKWPDHG